MRWRTRTGADHILAILRKVLNGHAARSDDFKNPLQGMNRAAPTMERASRTRILQDAELRAFWRATETFPGAYGHLTAGHAAHRHRMRRGRRNDPAGANRRELSGDVWTISAKPFQKAKSEAATNPRRISSCR